MRKYKNVVLSDISEMFLKVILDPEDRRYHRFHFNGEEYEWLVILFGNLASPNGSQKVIQLNCDLNGQGLDEALESVRNACYMDDVADSRPEEETALKLAQQLVILFDLCGMTVQKFYSNSELVCKNLDQNLLAKAIQFDEVTHDVVYNIGRVLGMSYSVPDDCLTYAGKFGNVKDWVKGKVDINIDSEPEQEGWTKRKLTQVSASVFDPLGLISPFLVRSKVIIQEVWKLKIDWDTKIPEEICLPWQDWLDQFTEIPNIKVTRWTGLKAKGTPYQIHTFCDASEEGICAAVYIRVKSGSDITTNLLAAKSRVSPLKAESISRSELVACVIAVRLSSVVRETYPTAVEDTFFWTDSEVCLRWINTPSKSFKAYVAHCVGEIQTFTEPRQWLHVPGVINPADIGTRPISIFELKDCQFWWEGPAFLKSEISDWPKTKIIQELESKELKQTIFLTTEHLKKADLDKFELLHPRHFSASKFGNGLQQCLIKWGHVLRAKRLFMMKKEDRPIRRPKLLRHTDYRDARTFITKQSQLEFFAEEIALMSKNLRPLAEIRGAKFSQILKFNPFLDPSGVIRSRSRLTNIPGLTYEKAHPIILHRKSDYARLIVESAHVEHQHPVGIQAMNAAIRNKFAINGMGTLCRQIQTKCTECRKLKAVANTQLMAPLPERRLSQKLKPFDNVGLDFAGPFEIKMGRGKIRKKVYVLVLTCMVTRGVHLETTGGVDTSHVIDAISRFADVRGVPATLTSDNQTSFRKADKEITEWYKSVDWDKVQQATGHGFRPDSDGIEWHFNPPNASHFGGIFEIIVKALKRAMKIVIGRADLDEEGFRTCVSKVMFMLNNRPIQQSGSIHDQEPLTPNHFLFSDLANAIFPPDFPEDKTTNLDKKLKQQVEMQKFVWRRFFLEFVPLLGPRQKWSQEQENLNVDDVVVELDENQPRGVWRLMRVSKIFPSQDGLVRKVEVTSTNNKSYIRPISKLIPIVRN
jgi:predicted nuclease with RNAse H fold